MTKSDELEEHAVAEARAWAKDSAEADAAEHFVRALVRSSRGRQTAMEP